MFARKTLTIPLHSAHKPADITQLACAILSSSSAELVYQMLLKVFLFITELLMHSILIEFFSTELSSPQYLLPRCQWCSRSHDTVREAASTEHYQIQLFVPIFFVCVLSTLCHSTWKTWCERSRRLHKIESQWGWALRVRIHSNCVKLRHLLWILQHCVHAEGCSSTRCQRTTFCAVLHGGQGCFNAVSDFFPLVLNFSLFSHTREKFGISQETWKNGTEGNIQSQVQDRAWQELAGAGLEGRAGMGDLARMGAWAGGGEGGTCVFLHKTLRRNRLDCA